MSDLLEQYFPDGAPSIVQVAFNHGYGPAHIGLNNKVYLNKQLSVSPIIREAIQCLCLSSCENQYCAVMHARGLIVEGFSLEETKQLVELQKLPSTMPDREIWEHTLRRVTTIFREPQAASHLYKTLTEFHSTQVIEDIGGIVAFALFAKFLLEFYNDEIDITKEPFLFQTVDCGQELISFFTQIGTQSKQAFVLCSLCKDVKSEAGWLPIEKALPDLPADALFSHSVCENCHNRWLKLAYQNE